MSRYIFANKVDPIPDNRYVDRGAETIDGAQDEARRIFRETGNPAYVFDTSDRRGPPVARGVHYTFGWRWLKRCPGGDRCEKGTCGVCCGAKYVQVT